MVCSCRAPAVGHHEFLLTDDQQVAEITRFKAGRGCIR
ncbi:hypothetical protein AMETH_3891 [Amycolatopsis methanolica 239]|uniref:Uncharacterized protein n=1 Tax=Amycolatopsis methanolica 239 TaxID=1068978 RepID=A0A076MSS6_AMYME|nr:hypothetical protein AMETH_3891 [Amycolatopsis methanolica 239]